MTAAGKVPAWHFMEIPTEERQLGKRAFALRSLAALAILAVVILILAAVTVKLYYHKEEVLPEVKNYVRQRITDAKGLWAKVDMKEFKAYTTGFFTNKKYVLEVIPEGSNAFLDRLVEEDKEVPRENFQPLSKPETNTVLKEP